MIFTYLTFLLQSSKPLIQLPGSFSKVSSYYQGLPPCVKQMVAGKGIDGINSALTYCSYASS